jgi:hypothetical protein
MLAQEKDKHWKCSFCGMVIEETDAGSILRSSKEEILAAEAKIYGASRRFRS